MKYKVGDIVTISKDYDREFLKPGSEVTISEINERVNDYYVKDSSKFNSDGFWYINEDDIDHEATKRLNKKDNEAFDVPYEHESKKGSSLRFNEGKPEFSHLSPQFILEMMKTMTKANEKYPYLNYTKRQDVKTASDSLMRHYLKFQLGEDLDEETECHHLAHLAVNAMIIFQNLHDFGEEVDTRYEIIKKKVQDES